MAVRVPFGVHITRLDRNDTVGVDLWLSMLERTWREEFPEDAPLSRRDYRSMLDHPSYGHKEELYVARASGAVIGACFVAFPLLDNTDNATVEIVVDIEHRRKGVGRALFRQAVKRARKHDRVRMIGAVRETYPGRPSLGWAAADFARAMGFTRALPEVRRRLDLAEVDDDELARLELDAIQRATGYRLVEWIDTAPDFLMDGLVVLESRMSTDIPLGDLVWGQEAVDRKRLRQMESVLIARGRRAYNVAAVHDATGDVAGTTRVVLDLDVPEMVWQWNTIVLPDHRGHRLGLLLKLANLRQLREAEPEAQWVDTWNAEENSFMIDVNAAMGFRPFELESEWQVEL